MFNKNNIYAGNFFSKQIKKENYIEYYDDNRNLKKSFFYFHEKDPTKVKFFIQFHQNSLNRKFLAKYDENQKIEKTIEYLIDGSKFVEKKYDKETKKNIEEIRYFRGGIKKNMFIQSDRITGRIIKYKIYNEQGEIINSY